MNAIAIPNRYIANTHLDFDNKILQDICLNDISSDLFLSKYSNKIKAIIEADFNLKLTDKNMGVICKNIYDLVEFLRKNKKLREIELKIRFYDLYDKNIEEEFNILGNAAFRSRYNCKMKYRLKVVSGPSNEIRSPKDIGRLLRKI
jgi:hypothetical protein